MVKLGVSPEAAKTAAASAAPVAVATVTSVEGQPTIQINDSLDRAWRRTGVALDRSGFTVEDRDRTKGVYFVRYVEPTADKKEPGLLSRIFSSSPSTAPLKFRVAVRSQGQGSTVSVLGADGTVDTSANAKRIVQLIADDLK